MYVCDFMQDADDYLASEGESATRTVFVHDADSSGQSDAEEMSDVLKKDPIISKYSKYRVTKKTAQQKSSRKCNLIHVCDLFGFHRWWSAHQQMKCVCNSATTTLLFFWLTLRQSRSNKAGVKCPSSHVYVRQSTKGFFDFNEIWHVGRDR